MEVAYLWILMGSCSFTCGLPILVGSICSATFHNKYWAVIGVSCGGFGILNTIAMCYVKVYCRHHVSRRPLVGRFGRCAIEALFVCIALIVRDFVMFDVLRRILLVLTTIYLYALAQLLHVADIGLVDVLLELFMQVMIYETRKEIYNTFLVLLFCGIVILFRCWSYSPPVKPVNISKKVVDDGAC